MWHRASSSLIFLIFPLWWIDPHLLWKLGRFWNLPDKSLRVPLERLKQNQPSAFVQFFGISKVYRCRRHEADRRMSVLLVIPLEKNTAEGQGVLETTKP